ncbi:MAG: hypothetical protein HY268_12205 [Deltaproteobacteria bacterium]|nr:hypothetical protein [Deltaproteobacteria bacterium]
MKRPEEVTLSREDGEALIERLEKDALTAEDRRVLVKVLTFYFWLLFALREAQLSLKRLRTLVFGEKPKKGEPPTSGGTAAGGGGGRQRSQDGRRTRSAPDLGTRAARIDFLYCRLYASVHLHRTLASSIAYARVPCRWTSMRPRAAQISGKIGRAICH